MREKKLILVMVVVLCAVFLTPYEGLAQKQGFDDKEIRIGQWGPQTGPAAPWGAIARGSKLLFDLVNEEGGIHGRKIRYFIRDDQYNPSQTMAAVRDLVDRRDVFAFVGGVGTAPGLAVQAFLKQREIIWVSPSTGAKNFYEPHNPYIWGQFVLYEDDGSIIAKFLAETKKFKKIGFLYQNDDWGHDVMLGINKRLKTYGMELIAALPVEPIERDLSSQITRLRSSGVEVVIGAVGPVQAGIALRTAVAMGFRPQWIHCSNLVDYVLMNHITDGLWSKEGVMSTAFAENIFDYKIPSVNYYAEAAKRLSPGERWGMFFAAGIVVAEPLVEALKRAGRELSKEAVVRELNNMTFQGIGPKIKWTTTNHRPPRELRIWQSGPGGEVIVLQDWTVNELPLEIDRKKN